MDLRLAINPGGLVISGSLWPVEGWRWTRGKAGKGMFRLGVHGGCLGCIAYTHTFSGQADEGNATCLQHISYLQLRVKLMSTLHLVVLLPVRFHDLKRDIGDES